MLNFEIARNPNTASRLKGMGAASTYHTWLKIELLVGNSDIFCLKRLKRVHACAHFSYFPLQIPTNVMVSTTVSFRGARSGFRIHPQYVNPCQPLRISVARSPSHEGILPPVAWNPQLPQAPNRHVRPNPNTWTLKLAMNNLDFIHSILGQNLPHT